MKHILLLVLFFTSSSLWAQLPKGLSKQEQSQLKSYFEKRANQNRAGITNPPSGSAIRTSAEWEEVQALVITWTGDFNGIQSQIVDAAQEECLVIISCNDSNGVKNILQNNGVPLVNLAFLEVSFNTIWIRDYAGNSVYTAGNDSLILVDWIYNRPRPNDDAMPEFHANLLNIPFYETTSAPTDLVNTGGNWMVDGQGTAFASELIIEENEPGNPYNVTVKTEPEIDAIVSDFMGIDRYIKMPTLPFDGIHHIDMHMKLLDEETLLVSEYPTGVADGPQIEANMQYVLSTYNSYFGTPYKMKRITVPPSTGGNYPDNGGFYRTYSNMVMVNKTILVPFYRTEYDTIAQRTLEEALPGYTIVGIDVDNSNETLISLSGAIHCITHTIGVEDPMVIVHQPLEDTYNTTNSYTVSAEVSHRSGIASAQLFYRLKGTTSYQSVAMTSTAQGIWEGAIPAQAAESVVEYYVEGTANSGKVMTRPIVAPDGYWSFKVLKPNSIADLATEGLSFGKVYPNPAKAITCIEINAQIEMDAEIAVYNALGKKVEEVHNGNLIRGKNQFFIHAENYASGIYFILLKGAHSQQFLKLVVQ